MAFGAKKIFPIDTRGDVGVGVSLPFNSNGVFQTTYTTQEALKTNLINYFLTEPGEIYLNPTFGGGLRSFIFENITNNTTQDLKDNIQTKISQNFPNVIVDELEVYQQYDDNSYNVVIKYRIQNTSISDQLQINFT
jgi:hypothetical protein